jgi:hypothetical protein
MEPDLIEIKKNYERLDEERIIRLASEEATGLRPEALELLKQVVKERRLPAIVTRSIEVQFEPMDENTLTAYCELLRRLPCPVCNSTAEKLNANTVASAEYRYLTRAIKVACPPCLDKAFLAANQRTALRGWQSILGLINIPRALLFNKKMKPLNHLPEATDVLKKFVSGRVGRIELNRDNPEGLADILLFPRGNDDDFGAF